MDGVLVQSINAALLACGHEGLIQRGRRESCVRQGRRKNIEIDRASRESETWAICEINIIGSHTIQSQSGHLTLSSESKVCIDQV